MRKFQNTLDPKKFRATNAAWNELTLNAPWSVGYVSSLVESENFKSKEDWEAFYYRSGEERNALLKKENEKIQRFMNFHILKKTKPENISKTPLNFKNLNYNFGRTREQLSQKGEILYQKMKEVEFEISLEECIEAVRFRVICETWNGIILRERNTIENLQKKFPDLIFEKTEGEFDHSYAVDYQCFRLEKLLFGIQIKPKSYTFKTAYIQKAKVANGKKNEVYSQKFKAPVFDLISQTNGVITNPKVLELMKEIM